MHLLCAQKGQYGLTDSSLYSILYGQSIYITVSVLSPTLATPLICMQRMRLHSCFSTSLSNLDKFICMLQVQEEAVGASQPH